MGLEQSPGINKPVQPELSFSDSQTDILPLPSGLNSTASIQSRDNRTTMGVRKSQNAKDAAQLKTSGLDLPVSSHINNTTSIYEQN
jgi:hypothetical protein